MDLDEMTDISYRMLSALKDYGQELSPAYLPAWKKSETQEFHLSKDSVRELLQKNTKSQ